MVGRTIAQYQLIDKLGAGGMGEIYRAQDTRLARSVAIKVLPESRVGDPDRRRRFLQEGRAASALNHPNIITIHDVVFEGQTAFMVMELVEGKTLGDLIASGPMPVPDVLKYATQMADALAAAHDAGIIHRDLKPGNVMITHRGLVKILDFGLAKLSAFSASAGGTGDSTTVEAVALTVEGSILGTVHYMSPEQAEGRTVDARSDIFSFGVMLYEMLSGNRPFVGGSTLSILSSILRDEAKPLSVSSPSVTRPIDELVARCIAKRPGDRWQSMHELHDALAALRNESDAQTLVLPPRRPVRRAPRMAAAAGALVLIAAAGAWWTLGRRTAPPPPPAASPGTVPPVPTSDAALTNDGVIAMLRGKVPQPVIQQQIRASQTRFDLSVSEIIRLTEAGASGELIETMRNPKGPAAATAKAKPDVPLAAAPTVPPPQSGPAAGPSPARPVPPPAAGIPAAEPGGPVAVVVPNLLPIEIELAEDVNADAEPGRPLHFTLVKELRIGQSLVAPAHATVLGEIVDGSRKKLIGGTRLTFRLKNVAAAGGSMLLLRANPSGRDTRPLESGSMPKPPKGVAAVIGTQYIAYTAGEQTLHVPK
jgi:serine/threonine-protein kinase